MNRKTIIEHLKHDIKEHKEAICSDSRLIRKLQSKKKKQKKENRRYRLWD